MLAATGASAYETSAVITGEKVLNSHNERVSCDWLHLHTHTHTHTPSHTHLHTQSLNVIYMTSEQNI